MEQSWDQDCLYYIIIICPFLGNNINLIIQSEYV